MKKKYMRLTALVLALVMLLSVTALAEENKTLVANDKMTITGVDGATVTVDSTNDEKLHVTFESASVKEGQFYLVMVVADDGKGNYVPTKDTILYINQTTGVAGSDGKGKIEFTGNDAVYPSTLKNSAILIYGVGVDGETNSLVAAIIEMKFVLGDVDGDGAITASDAAKLLRVVAKLESLDSTQTQAGNVDGDSAITASDAAKILRVVAKLEPIS